MRSWLVHSLDSLNHMKPTTIALLACLAFASGCASKSTARPQWLPDPNEQVVYSFQSEGNDLVRVKAKVSPSEFTAATQKLKMIPLSSDSDSADNLDVLRWKKGPDKQWDPSPSMDSTFLCHRDDWWETAKYENGFMYYQLIAIKRAVTRPGTRTDPRAKKP